MNETYFPDDIWGEIKSFLLHPPLPKDPHPLSILIKDLSTIYHIDPPKENILFEFNIRKNDRLIKFVSSYHTRLHPDPIMIGEQYIYFPSLYGVNSLELNLCS